MLLRPSWYAYNVVTKSPIAVLFQCFPEIFELSYYIARDLRGFSCNRRGENSNCGKYNQKRGWNKQFPIPRNRGDRIRCGRECREEKRLRNDKPSHAMPN